MYDCQECGGEFRHHRLKLGEMVLRKCSQEAFPFRGEAYQDLSPIVRGGRPRDEAPGPRPIDEFNRGVVPDLEALSRDADRNAFITNAPRPDREQQLVLLRLDAGGTCRRLAKSQEMSYQVAKLMEPHVVVVGKPPRAHVAIISRCDT